MCKTCLSLPQTKLFYVGLYWLVLSLSTVEKYMASFYEDRLFLLWPLSKAIWEDSSFPEFQLEMLLGNFVCCYYNYLKMNVEVIKLKGGYF